MVTHVFVWVIINQLFGGLVRPVFAWVSVRFMFIWACACAYAFAYAYVYVRACVCACAYVYVRACICVQKHSGPIFTLTCIWGLCMCTHYTWACYAHIRYLQTHSGPFSGYFYPVVILSRVYAG